MAIFGYIRVSTKSQLEGYGLEQQRAAILSKYPDATIYCDNGISGTVLSRAGLNGLLSVLKAGDSLVVRELSRLWRCDFVAADIKRQLIEKQVNLIDLSDSSYQLDPKDPTIYLFQHIREGLAQFEKMQIVAKLAAARAQKRASGNYACGRAPFGYKWTIEAGKNQHKLLAINPEEAEMVKQAYKLRKAGATLENVGIILGGKSRRMAKYILENEIYKGVGAPAIVSARLWNAINK